MSKLLIACVVVAMFVGSVSAQETSGLVWGGYRNDGGHLASYGFGVDLGGGLWAFTGMNAGEYADWSIFEVAYLIPVGKLFFGPVAGPAVDWVAYQPETPVAYMTGAAGGLIGYEIGKVGLWGYAKYKFTYVEDDLYQDGTAIGGGLFYKFAF